MQNTEPDAATGVLTKAFYQHFNTTYPFSTERPLQYVGNVTDSGKLRLDSRMSRTTNSTRRLFLPPSHFHYP